MADECKSLFRNNVTWVFCASLGFRESRVPLRPFVTQVCWTGGWRGVGVDREQHTGQAEEGNKLKCKAWLIIGFFSPEVTVVNVSVTIVHGVLWYRDEPLEEAAWGSLHSKEISNCSMTDKAVVWKVALTTWWSCPQGLDSSHIELGSMSCFKMSPHRRRFQGKMYIRVVWTEFSAESKSAARRVYGFLLSFLHQTDAFFYEAELKMLVLEICFHCSENLISHQVTHCH